MFLLLDCVSEKLVTVECTAVLFPCFLTSWAPYDPINPWSLTFPNTFLLSIVLAIGIPPHGHDVLCPPLRHSSSPWKVHSVDKVQIHSDSALPGTSYGALSTLASSQSLSFFKWTQESYWYPPSHRLMMNIKAFPGHWKLSVHSGSFIITRKSVPSVQRLGHPDLGTLLLKQTFSQNNWSYKGALWIWSVKKMTRPLCNHVEIPAAWTESYIGGGMAGTRTSTHIKDAGVIDGVLTHCFVTPVPI